MRQERVLFLCTGNSCRSQMAEGWLKHLGGERFAVFSAGTKPAGMHADAVSAMREAGVDISGQHSKSAEEFVGQQFDYVITVCDSARAACPVFPGAAQKLHWSFADPAGARGTEEERMRVFRRVRDEIAARLQEFVRKESAGAAERRK